VFDFRYHAISLVAVFLALGIGILLGVTIGDSLLSEADRSLRDSLREDVVKARAQEALAVEGLEGREEVIARVVPDLVARTLQGVRVAVVAVGRVPEGLEADVRAAVEQADGSLDSVSIVPVNPAALAGPLGVRAEGPDLQTQAAARLAAAVAAGGPAAQRLKQEFPDDFSGAFEGADAVVFHGVDPRQERLAAEAQDWEEALITQLRESSDEVVGVESSGPAEGSQVAFYSDQDISSVDNLDSAGGQAALALALAGAQGHFGYKGSADEVLPQLRAVR
jgi:hypothetical protein